LQYQQITGRLPNGLHSGLKEGGVAPMDGLPDAQAEHFDADHSDTYGPRRKKCPSC
jgi:hypothetical protein